MDHIVHATFIDGVFKPLEQVTLPSGTKVQLTVIQQKSSEDQAAWESFEQKILEYATTGLRRLSREQLHDRRV